MKYSTEEMLNDLNRVAKLLGDSPTSREYEEYGEIPLWTVKSRFGSWNSAKERAGLDTFSPHGPGYREGGSAEEWYIKKKENGGCLDCPEDDPRVLSFHHVGEKTMNVSAMVAQQYGLGRVKAEAEKCVLLCANCHRKRHMDGPRDGWA